MSRAACELAAHPAILDLAESILGPDLLAWMAELFFTDAGSDQVVSLRQGLTYWDSESTDLVTGWLALNEVAEDNGAMTVVRGSHRLDQQQHENTFAHNNLPRTNNVGCVAPLVADFDPAAMVPMRSSHTIAP